MKLNREAIKNAKDWPGYSLPKFDVSAMVERSKKEPIWLHIGAGNIFRAFPALLQQELLNAGLTDKGITVCEGYDEEIIPKVFAPHDNLSLAVTLKADGSTEKTVVASIAEAINLASQKERLMEIISAPSLQMISFTITEKGYNKANPLWDVLREALQKREKPITLVSMDNVAKNGDVLKEAIDSNSKHAFPWTMIDKITPRPSSQVADMLKSEGFEDTGIITTTKGTWVAPFTIAEECQYLVIEEAFPSGRPPLEKAKVYFTDRKTVGLVEKMKVCTCLNPIHTILAISGCLLGHDTIANTMKDQRLVALVKQFAYKEAMPVVANPIIIDPQEFLRDVLELRLNNPFLGDAPQRIATDTSQKIPMRFGETLKLRHKAGLPDAELRAIPFFIALWAHYLQSGKVEPDPRAEELKARSLKELFSDATIFGVDLYAGEGTLAAQAEAFFGEISENLEKTLDKYWA